MKTMRHAMILEIIEAKNIETQEELAEELRHHGVNVTQATVSRDIKELRLLKVLSDNGGYRYATAERAEKGINDRFIRIFSESVMSIAGAGNLIVLKTLSASAPSAAEAIDSLKWPEIIGTIAGDNTILVIIKNIEDVDEVIARFRELIGNRI
ncbi:MAG: arginine repressor [Clostridia bacterium]|nr:arginine repressor [Clostridia bacterium]MBQ4618999.1 arginine repressor [Clostridia bacterium]